MKTSFKTILPEYPSIWHLPWKPNNKGDKVMSEKEASIIFDKDTSVQEKLDGANCGMAFIDGHPVVRSRTKILRKGQELKNPSQAQFSSSWNWMHKNQEKFELLKYYGPFSVYGEFLIQQHGMSYNNLPDWFIAYDIYDYEKEFFLPPNEALFILSSCGFAITKELFYGKIESYEQLEKLANGQTSFDSDAQREGLVLKIADGNKTHWRFKMVRQGFDQGSLLGDVIVKNKLG